MGQNPGVRFPDRGLWRGQPWDKWGGEMVGQIRYRRASVWVRVRLSTMMGEESDGGWLRSKGAARLIRIYSWGFAVFLLVQLIIALTVPGPFIAKAGLFGLCVLGTAAIWGGLKAADRGCRIDAEGLLVRGIQRTRLIPWSDIDAIDLGQYGIHPQVCRVLLRDGSTVAVTGISSSPWRPQDRQAEAIIAQLQLALEKTR